MRIPATVPTWIEPCIDPSSPSPQVITPRIARCAPPDRSSTQCANLLAVYYTRCMRRQPNNTTSQTSHQPALTRRDLLRAGLGVAGTGLLAGCGLSTAHSEPPK